MTRKRKLRIILDCLMLAALPVVMARSLAKSPREM